MVDLSAEASPGGTRRLAGDSSGQPPGDGARERALREAIELFYFGYRAFTAGPDRILAARDLGRVHHRILYFVGRTPGLVVNDLLAILSISKQALNAPLRQLIALDLVTVQPAPRDRRYKQLRLTSDGTALEAQLTATQIAQLAAVFDATGTDAEQGWRAVLRALPNNG